MDVALNTQGELDLTNGYVNLVNDVDAVAQHMKIRLGTFLGEWFLDTRIGIPYYRDVLVKNPNRLVVESIFRDVIINTNGISGIDGFTFNLDSSTRTLRIETTPILEDGTTFNFIYEEMVLNI